MKHLTVALIGLLLCIEMLGQVHYSQVVVGRVARLDITDNETIDFSMMLKKADKSYQVLETKSMWVLPWKSKKTLRLVEGDIVEVSIGNNVTLDFPEGIVIYSLNIHGRSDKSAITMTGSNE